MVESTRTHIDASTYYQLSEYEQHDLIQLIDGEVVIGMPPILKHQVLIKKILLLLAKVEAEKGGVAFIRVKVATARRSATLFVFCNKRVR